MTFFCGRKSVTITEKGCICGGNFNLTCVAPPPSWRGSRWRRRRLSTSRLGSLRKICQAASGTKRYVIKKTCTEWHFSIAVLCPSKFLGSRFFPIEPKIVDARSYMAWNMKGLKVVWLRKPLNLGQKYFILQNCVYLCTPNEPVWWLQEQEKDFNRMAKTKIEQDQREREQATTLARNQPGLEAPRE